VRQVGLHGLATRVAHFEQPVFAWNWLPLAQASFAATDAAVRSSRPSAPVNTGW
jgi:hypothetical protein